MRSRLLGGLSRRTSSRRYVPSLDGIRAVGLALVLATHAEVVRSLAAGHAVVVEPFGRIYRPDAFGPRTYDGPTRVLLQGHVGLDLFFLVSAFMLVLPFAAARFAAKPAPPVLQYLTRRMARLGPPYMAALLITFAVGAAVSGSVSARGLLPHLGASLAFLHAPLLGGVNPVNGPVWSLEVEVQFYALLPVLAAAFLVPSTVLRRGLIVAAAVAISWAQAVGVASEGWLSISVANYLQFFLMGFLLADVYLREWASDPAPHWGWDVVTVVGWPALVWISVIGSGGVDHLLLPWVAVAVAAAAIRGPWTARLLSTPWLVTVGAISYSIYLLHYPVLILVGRALRPLIDGSHWPGLGILVCVAMPLVLLAGVGLFRLVERPSMDPEWPARVARRLGGRRSETRARAPAA